MLLFFQWKDVYWNFNFNTYTIFDYSINFHRLRYPSEIRPSTVSLCSIMRKKKTARGGPTNQLSMRGIVIDRSIRVAHNFLHTLHFNVVISDTNSRRSSATNEIFHSICATSYLYLLVDLTTLDDKKIRKAKETRASKVAHSCLSNVR